MPHDPSLASNIDAIARGSSQWVKTTRTLEALPFDAVEAMQAAYGPVAGVATLIVPDGLRRRQRARGLRACRPRRPRAPHPRSLAAREVESAAKALREAKSPLVLLGGPASDARGLRLGAAIAEAVGGKLLFEQFPRCARREPGLPSPDKLGYLPFMARGQLGDHDVVALFGADPPALFFGYPGEAPRLTRPDAKLLEPARGGDVHAALEAVAELVSARQAAEERGPKGRLRSALGAARAERDLPRDRRAFAGKRDRGRRGHHLVVAALLDADRRRPARLPGVQGRLDRLRHAGRDGRRDRGSRTPGRSPTSATARPRTRSNRCGLRRAKDSM